MTPATHRGSCQICGRIQKLPGELLSKHGYTVEWNMFNGTCRGSSHLPFEKSCELIPPMIQSARERRNGLIEFQKELLATPVEGTREAWVEVYRRTGRMSSYQWMKVLVVFTEHTGQNDYKWLTAQYKHPDKETPERLDGIGYPQIGKEIEFIQKLNLKRAQALDPEIRRLAEYIKWQENRLEMWKEQPLLPLDDRHQHAMVSATEPIPLTNGRGHSFTERCACKATRQVFKIHGRNRYMRWSEAKPKVMEKKA